jgi:hypothetical protein
MKVETLNLHGLNLDEAVQKTRQNLAWCMNHGVDVLDINHGKGYHSSRNFSVLKHEIRKILKSETSIKDHGYRVIYGESKLPIALKFDEGHTLIVIKGLESKYIGGHKQQRKDKEIFSVEARQKRKTKKNIRALNKKRHK